MLPLHHYHFNLKWKIVCMQPTFLPLGHMHLRLLTSVDQNLRRHGRGRLQKK